MREPPASPGTFPPIAALLAAAPHRPLFLAGALAVLTSMAWWALELASMRFGWHGWPQPPVPPGWAHAMLTQYGMLPMFMFGFLLTTFPKWLARPAIGPRRYVAVAGSVFVGYLLSHVGLLDMPWVLRAGTALMLLGYLVGVTTLAGVLRASEHRNQHAWSCLAALCLGTLGLAAFLAFLFGAPAHCARFAVKLGTFGLLVPVYFTVAHRMVAFFSGNLVKDYVVRRPDWSLPVIWLLLLAHLGLDLAHAQSWLWVVDAPLALLFGWHSIAWQPWKAMRPGLLGVLHLAFAWLPIAFALYAVQSLCLFAGHGPILGLAPLHVLTIGYFGSMLVAMVTRVTQGHSGRPLQMGAVPWVCFVLLQGVVLLRVWAELARDSYLWLVVAACGWLVAFLPWVLRSAWIYLTPRVDGRPG
ncbi:NnrS family protein [Frateuria soli]|uniref:NnrS family protein n=1 Tax=Frateuria soli TaxID=1542730 RepID=UPI001E55FD16|nr:NnrS family protein [Frateuria soli]UGB37609.1 NnrS family protein [Frateuria soli]